jgi:chromosome segregation ATPase
MNMTPEERERYDRIDRTLEFLANSHAQLSADLVRLSDELDTLKDTTAELKETTAELKSITEMHSAQIEAQGKQIGELGTFVLRLGHVMEEQVEAQARTDERLNTLIGVVERYFSNGRN